jgi:hypothetical protein
MRKCVELLYRISIPLSKFENLKNIHYDLCSEDIIEFFQTKLCQSECKSEMNLALQCYNHIRNSSQNELNRNAITIQRIIGSNKSDSFVTAGYVIDLSRADYQSIIASKFTNHPNR